MEMKLKPCPFCGNKHPETWWDISEPYYEEGYNISCCYVNISKIYRNEAIDAWNDRYNEK